MTKSETHDPLPSHVNDVIHQVVRNHVMLPTGRDDIGPLAQLGHRHYRQLLGHELEPHPTLYKECHEFMVAEEIKPSNHPDYSSSSRLAAIRKIDVVMPEELKKALTGDSHEVIPQGTDRHFDLAAEADQPLST